MCYPKEIKFPENFEWEGWISRYDKMQQRHVVKRDERLDVILNLVRASCDSVKRVLDLGCGTGTLMLKILEEFSQAEVVGIDFDPYLLPLTRHRLKQYSERSRLILADLRKKEWLEDIVPAYDAVVSTTALHWLEPNELQRSYFQIADILRAGGLFLNADHVGSENTRIQEFWESCRQDILDESKEYEGEDWETFWKAYMDAINLKLYEIDQRVLNSWGGGVEEGMPLSWHFDKLKKAGFICIDCFWRCDCDAVYGGILGPAE